VQRIVGRRTDKACMAAVGNDETEIVMLRHEPVSS
jgi:hypothetical protein